MGLQEYYRKRDFKRTPEPKGAKKSSTSGHSFVIQKHAASHLHYDFRLELNGTLKSWAVPKGPSLNPADKRLAMHVEDHPLDYQTFEGIIPQGQYGGGTVMVWDRGEWISEDDAEAAYRKGHLRFTLNGEKLHGAWSLIRMQGKENAKGKEAWLLVKAKDEFASEEDIADTMPNSVVSGRSIEEIAKDQDRVWQSNKKNDSKLEKLLKTTSSAPKQEKAKPKKTEAKKVLSKTSVPEILEPQLATLVDKVPLGANWIHEIKFDGYRTLCRIQDGEVTLFSRNNLDWTTRFAPIAKAIRKLPIKNGWLDGEVVVLEENGASNFGALQEALSDGRDEDLVYCLFDLLYQEHEDLRRLPVVQRKQRLAELLIKVSDKDLPLRYSDHIEAQGELFYDHACNVQLEGIISKRGDRPYLSGRNKDWVKVKCLQRQEFIICGYSSPSGSREAFGSLILGLYDDDGNLVYSGRVGTGFNDATLRELGERFKSLKIQRHPFVRLPRDPRNRDVTWLKPELVAEIEFTNWTSDGVLRHPSFQGLREDKAAREVKREYPKSLEADNKQEVLSKKSSKTDVPSNSESRNKPKIKSQKKAEAQRDEIAGIRLSNPNKVLYKAQGVTKQDIALYYEAIADWVMPDLKARPLTLVRCPEGSATECFFQKHATERVPDVLERIEIEEKGESDTYMLANSLSAVIALVQMGVLEIHIWGCHSDRIEYPDRLVFDFDPDQGLAWQSVVEAAIIGRARLQDLGLESFVKTTGGKGLHVVVPITRRLQWPEVKAFTKAFAEDLVRSYPDRFTSNLLKIKRKGKIFVDYLRNGRGATAIANYSTRARDGAPVSVPLAWQELSNDLRSDQFNVKNVIDRLSKLKKDPWQDYFKIKQGITKQMQKALGMKV